MTTTVIIEAHCPDDVEVQVLVMENRTIEDSVILQDGETKEVHVFDQREVSVKEVKRFKPVADPGPAHSEAAPGPTESG